MANDFTARVAGISVELGMSVQNKSGIWCKPTVRMELMIDGGTNPQQREANVWWDTNIAGWVLNENEKHGLKPMYNKYILNGEGSDEDFGDLFEGIPCNYILNAEYDDLGAGHKIFRGKYYIVQKGDNLWNIAKRFYGAGAEYYRIVRKNHLQDPNHIEVGQKLYL